MMWEESCETRGLFKVVYSTRERNWVQGLIESLLLTAALEAPNTLIKVGEALIVISSQALSLHIASSSWT